jgi:hypothetical protein
MRERVETILFKTSTVDATVLRQSVEFKEIEETLASLYDLSNRLLEASRKIAMFILSTPDKENIQLQKSVDKYVNKLSFFKTRWTK